MFPSGSTDSKDVGFAVFIITKYVPVGGLGGRGIFILFEIQTLPFVDRISLNTWLESVLLLNLGAAIGGRLNLV